MATDKFRESSAMQIREFGLGEFHRSRSDRIYIREGIFGSLTYSAITPAVTIWQTFHLPLVNLQRVMQLEEREREDGKRGAGRKARKG